MVPKLRFPGFRDQWVKKRIGDLGQFIGGGTPESSKTEYWRGNIPWISSSDIKENSIHIINKTRFITNDAIRQSATKIVPLGSILMVSRVGIGKFAVANEDLCTSQDFTNLIANEDSYFLAYYFKSKSNRFIKLSQGTSIQGFTGKDIKNTHFAIPSPPEQQKIASFLTAVDTKIEQLTKKINLLEQYKKGVMQKIFAAGEKSIKNQSITNYESENENPNNTNIRNSSLDIRNSSSHIHNSSFQTRNYIRFKKPDGSNYPDWEEKKLGEVADYFDGTHQTPKYVNEGIPFYSVEHVTANQFQNTKFISKDVFIKENKRVKLEKGDILMTRIGSIGVARYIDWNVKASFYVSLALIKTKKRLIGKYLSQFISSSFFQKELWKRTIHVAFPQKINLGEIGYCIVLCPSLEEQTQIANFLSSIDDKIALVNTQLEKTQQFKKGLLQQMFA